MVLTKIVEVFIDFGIWLFLKIVPKEPADRYERMKMKSPNETRTMCIDFLGDDLIETMQEVINWLKEKDLGGYHNSFYVLSIHTEHDNEFGWVITVIRGE